MKKVRVVELGVAIVTVLLAGLMSISFAGEGDVDYPGLGSDIQSYAPEIAPVAPPVDSFDNNFQQSFDFKTYDYDMNVGSSSAPMATQDFNMPAAEVSNPITDIGSWASGNLISEASIPLSSQERADYVSNGIESMINSGLTASRFESQLTTTSEINTDLIFVTDSTGQRLLPEPIGLDEIENTTNKGYAILSLKPEFEPKREYFEKEFEAGLNENNLSAQYEAARGLEAIYKNGAPSEVKTIGYDKIADNWKQYADGIIEYTKGHTDNDTKQFESAVLTSAISSFRQTNQVIANIPVFNADGNIVKGMEYQVKDLPTSASAGSPLEITLPKGFHQGLKSSMPSATVPNSLALTTSASVPKPQTPAASSTFSCAPQPGQLYGAVNSIGGAGPVRSENWDYAQEREDIAKQKAPSITTQAPAAPAHASAQAGGVASATQDPYIGISDKLSYWNKYEAGISEEYNKGNIDSKVVANEMAKADYEISKAHKELSDYYGAKNDSVAQKEYYSMAQTEWANAGDWASRTKPQQPSVATGGGSSASGQAITARPGSGAAGMGQEGITVDTKQKQTANYWADVYQKPIPNPGVGGYEGWKEKETTVDTKQKQTANYWADVYQKPIPNPGVGGYEGWKEKETLPQNKMNDELEAFDKKASEELKKMGWWDQIVNGSDYQIKKAKERNDIVEKYYKVGESSASPVESAPQSPKPGSATKGISPKPDSQQKEGGSWGPYGFENAPPANIPPAETTKGLTNKMPTPTEQPTDEYDKSYQAYLKGADNIKDPGAKKDYIEQVNNSFYNIGRGTIDEYDKSYQAYLKGANNIKDPGTKKAYIEQVNKDFYNIQQPAGGQPAATPIDWASGLREQYNGWKVAYENAADRGKWEEANRYKDAMWKTADEIAKDTSNEAEKKTWQLQSRRDQLQSSINQNILKYHKANSPETLDPTMRATLAGQVADAKVELGDQAGANTWNKLRYQSQLADGFETTNDLGKKAWYAKTLSEFLEVEGRPKDNVELWKKNADKAAVDAEKARKEVSVIDSLVPPSLAFDVPPASNADSSSVSKVTKPIVVPPEAMDREAAAKKDRPIPRIDGK